MRTTEFKVHTIYSKEDILKMQKITMGKFRTISVAITGLVLILYAALLIWTNTTGQERESLFSFMSNATLDTILIAALVFSMIVVILLPYIQTKQILKAAPGGVLRANFYFYEKTFQYGWGNSFTTIAYPEVEEFRVLNHTFYLKAKGIAYWIKKSDFEVGEAEAFLTYIKSKIKCKIIGE